MSTYLLAFFVGRFDHKEATTTSGLLYRAWARPESVQQTAVALDVGAKTIVNYENYFGIDFPLTKQGTNNFYTHLRCCLYCPDCKFI